MVGYWPSSLFAFLKKKKEKKEKARTISSHLAKSQKSLYGHGKYFAEDTFRAPARTSAKCYCKNKTSNPERAVSLHLVPREANHSAGFGSSCPIAELDI